MIQSYIDTPVALSSNTDVVRFQRDCIRTGSSSCANGLQHSEGSPLYKLFKGGIYEITFNGTISSATAGVVALALFMDGQPVPGTVVAETLTAADDYASVSFDKRIKVCCGGDVTLSVGSVPSVVTPTTPTAVTTTQTPIIVNGNFILNRIA